MSSTMATVPSPIITTTTTTTMSAGAAASSPSVTTTTTTTTTMSAGAAASSPSVTTTTTTTTTGAAAPVWEQFEDRRFEYCKNASAGAFNRVGLAKIYKETECLNKSAAGQILHHAKKNKAEGDTLVRTMCLMANDPNAPYWASDEVVKALANQSACHARITRAKEYANTLESHEKNPVVTKLDKQMNRLMGRVKNSRVRSTLHWKKAPTRSVTVNGPAPSRRTVNGPAAPHRAV